MLKLKTFRGCNVLIISLMMVSLAALAKGPKDDYTVVVAPADISLDIGQSQIFSAYLEDGNGNIKDTTFAWSIQGQQIGTINGNGSFLAVSAGKTKILATAGKLKGTANVTVLGDKGKHGFHISVSPEDTLVAPGQSIQFSAILTDSTGTIIDTTFTWTVDEELGIIDTAGFFTASANKSQGFVWASVGELSGKAHVVIRDTTAVDTSAIDSTLKLIVLPKDTLVTPGSTLQMYAYLEDSLGVRSEVEAEWRVLAKRIGTINATGVFTANRVGTCLIRGKANGLVGKTRIYIATEEQIAAIDSVKFRIKTRNGNQIGNIKRLTEKNVLKISGLPFPLNVLNGVELAIPAGSLEEEVTMDVTLPDIHEIVNDTTLSFTEAILNGIAFHVYIGDSLVEPYNFKEPVELCLPYKPEAMAELGLTVDDLWIFFYNDSAGFDSTGITDVVVDTVENKIYALVHHFSQIVVASQNAADNEDDGSIDISTGISNPILPVSPQLYNNYPNPFNPETLIRFYIPANAGDHITLSIYNLLGQEVKQLHQGMIQPGYHVKHWDGTDNFCKSVSSGIYICRLEAGDIVRNRRMILMR